MKILFISGVPYGSTGKIIKSISKRCENSGIQTTMFFGWTKKRAKAKNVFVGSFFGKLFHSFLSKITGFEDSFSVIDTLRLIHLIKRIKPDIINLHLIHSWYVNLNILFNYLSKTNIKIIWTFHDCWSFTGHCTHFTLNSCYLWKTGCHNCSRLKDYPMSIVDNSKRMWNKKKNLFTSVRNITVVTPSIWLSKLVQESFFKQYKIQVINNGIDLSKFKPSENDLRIKYNLANRIVILGVCMDWGYKKGLDIFVELSDKLPSSEYAVILVGIKKVEIEKVAPNIISIDRTNSQEELAKYYTSADIFLNPTREENFPTVNIESLACGTPVITFDTGGCSEIIDDSCGVVLKEKDLDHVLKAIESIKNKKQSMHYDCIKRSKQFDENICFEQYISLFREIDSINHDK